MLYSTKTLEPIWLGWFKGGCQEGRIKYKRKWLFVLFGWEKKMKDFGGSNAFSSLASPPKTNFLNLGRKYGKKKKKEEEEGKEKNGLKTKGNFAPILMLSSNIYLKSIHFVLLNLLILALPSPCWDTIPTLRFHNSLDFFFFIFYYFILTNFINLIFNI